MRTLSIAVVLAAAQLVVPPPALAAAPSGVSRVSVSTAGAQGDGYSYAPQVSADGTHVVFYSSSTTLVAGDANDEPDVFVRDVETGTTTLVSVATGGGSADEISWNAAISGDGRYVAFQSDATDLVAGPVVGNVYVRDLVAGTTTALPVRHEAFDDAPLSISDDGTRVAYLGPTTGSYPSFRSQVLVYDRAAATSILATPGTTGAPAAGTSYGTSLSGDGSRIAITSNAPDLVAGDSGTSYDTFVRDLDAGTTTMVSHRAGDPASVPTAWQSYDATISHDGTAVTFLLQDPSTFRNHVFVRAVDGGAAGGAARPVSVTSAGALGNGDSSVASVSDGGRFVAFRSYASDLVPGDAPHPDDPYYAYDVFVRDTVAGTTRLVSRTPAGAPANGRSSLVDLSADGTRVAFHSDATDLVAGDTNGQGDVFLDVAGEPAAVTPHATTAPTWSGTARVGQVLRANPGAWDQAGLAYAYTWVRDGRPIAGATTATYRLGAADVAHRVAVLVTATRSGLEPGYARSSATPAVPRVRATLTATLAPQQTLLAKAGRPFALALTLTTPGVAPTGRVTVKVAGTRVPAAARRGVTVRLRSGRGSAGLPGLPPGSYTITATVPRTATVEGARAAVVRLQVARRR